MNSSENIKTMVREKYAEIALQSPELNAASCCGVDGCATIDYSIFSEDYTDLDGYVKSADLKLGCGMPVEHAQIRPGHTVLDLGSGAGNDVFIARALTGASGKVIGVDMTPEMITQARLHKESLGLDNVSFRLGEIEHLPVAAEQVDVVISNCVLNLVPDKSRAFEEVFRVLKPGGHFCISDVVLKGELPDKLRSAAEMYAGCVSGALQKEEYLSIVNAAGFSNVAVKSEKEVVVPDEILSNYLSEDELKAFHESGTGIYSVTAFASKEACCDPGSGCC